MFSRAERYSWWSWYNRDLQFSLHKKAGLDLAKTNLPNLAVDAGQNSDVSGRVYTTVIHALPSDQVLSILTVNFFKSNCFFFSLQTKLILK